MTPLSTPGDRSQRAAADGDYCRNLRNAVVTTDETLAVVDVNEAACLLYGYSREEMLAMNFTGLEAQADPPGAAGRGREGAEAGAVLEMRHLRKDGTALAVEVSSSAVQVAGVARRVWFIRDIGRCRAHEEHVSRLSQLYWALSRVNHAVARTTDARALKDEVCRILVESGSLKLTWIGSPDASGRIVPEARHGDGGGYLDDISVAVGEDDPVGRGPAGEAFRGDRTIVVNDFLEDERVAPWRERAAANGLRACAAIPLRQRGKAVGVLIAYAGRTGFFAAEEVALVEEAARAVSYALEMLRQNEARRKALLALETSESRLRLLVSATPAIIYTCRASDFSPTFVSENVATILGYQSAAFLSDSDFWANNVHPDDRQRALAAGDKVLRDGYALREYRFRRSDGEYVWMEDESRVVYDEDGRPSMVAGCWWDVSQRRGFEEALRVRQEIFTSIFEQAADAIALVDAESGRFVEFNEAAHRGLGYTREEFSALRVCDVQSDASALEAFEELRAAGPSGRIEFQTRHRDRSGDRRITHVRARGLSLRGRSYIAAVWNDITEREKAAEALRRSEELYRLIADNTSDVIWIYDLVGNSFRYISPSSRKVLGREPSELLGRGLDVVLTPESFRLALDGIEERVAAFEGGAEAERSRLMQLDHVAHDGRLVHGEVVVSLLPDENGRVTQLLGVLRNITDRLRAAEELRRSRDRLEEERNSLARRVEERTADLSRLNVELARAARAKDEFLANMSHELRTPLNAILALSETLLEQIRGPLNERQQSSVRTIEASGRHLLALITDILDLSKVEAGRMELQRETFALSDACESSIAFVKEVAAKKRLEVGLYCEDRSLTIEADPRRVKQMIVNLLSNAVKFTPNGGKVSVSIRADVSYGQVHIEVADTGIGMSPEQTERLFQPFVQLDSSLSREHEGTGLGLALVRRLAELHGGNVSVTSEPGRGSTFTITLPRVGALQADQPAPAPRPPLAAEIHKAVIVEDSESAADQLARYLEETGVASAIHARGEGAVDFAAQVGPDVIFLDLMLPDENGWKVLGKLKSDPRTAHTPVVIASVLDERSKAVAAGATGYLVKPISREAVLSALDSAAAALRNPVTGPDPALIPESAEPVAPRILLADDGEFNIIAIGDYLIDMGYDVSIARDGEEALRTAERVRPQLILMDVQMPRMDGLEATRRLRLREEFARTPIIALTGLAMDGDRERCMRAGATDYLTKPVSPRVLVDTIRRFLSAGGNAE